MINIKEKICWLCGTNAGKKETTTAEIYYHCFNCDLIFMDERFILDSEEEHKRYNMHDNTIDNEGYVRNFKRFIETAGIDKLDREAKVLDFGCGPGPVLKYLLNELGFHVDIYDQYFFPEEVYKGKKYDLITCTEVLEHLKNPFKTLKLLESLLNNYGRLAVTTLFHSTSNDFDNWWYRRDPTHFCFYSPHTFEWMQKQFNFNIEVIDYYNTCVLKKTETGCSVHCK